MQNYINTFSWHYEENDFPPRRPFGAKYLLCELDNEKFFVADSLCEEHKDIHKKYLNSETKVLGGGCVYFYGPEKGFVLNDSSLIYGAVNHDDAKAILETMFRVPVVVNIEKD